MLHIHRALIYGLRRPIFDFVSVRSFHASTPSGGKKRNSHRPIFAFSEALYERRSTFNASPWAHDKDRYNQCRVDIRCAIELIVQTSRKAWSHQGPDAELFLYKWILPKYHELRGFLGIATFIRIVDSCADNKRRYAAEHPNKQYDRALERARARVNMIDLSE
ncbi:hypothetical protein FRC17_005724 [Serendipita sp. 399]|nr:hypothetical protein FRC17_005724 [Serendipita sp. 399]